MDLIDRLEALGEKFEKIKDQVDTEEATKNALVMPFIRELGYDVFNPLEVVPEFTADIGLKKGEKVDYCILKENHPIIIIECKHWKEPLDVHKTQLHRYFHATSAKFGIITNGVIYRFYTDLVSDNIMDDKPFLEINLTKLNESVMHGLKRFHKDSFDADAIQNVASDLKYSKEIKELLSHELKSPSQEFVKYFVARVYSGRATQKILEQFNELVSRSSKSLINDLVNERLQNALNQQSPIEVSNSDSSKEIEQEPENEEYQKKGIETTEEELSGFRVVQAILAEHIDMSRIHYRDTKSYFGILLDDNNRKPICRLWLNKSTKYLETFGENKESVKVPIEKLEDIYKYKENIIKSIEAYE